MKDPLPLAAIAEVNNVIVDALRKTLDQCLNQDLNPYSSDLATSSGAMFKSR
jgi:hypothetical protein